MMLQRITVLMLMVLVLTGCESTDPVESPSDSADPSSSVVKGPAQRPIAYVNGRAITNLDLKDPLIEAAGGTVLSEVVLDRVIQERLEQAGLELTPELVEQEKSYMLATMSDDPDVAVTMLREMRTRRGLGDHRFESMLYRNAGLRLLIQDQVQIVPTLLRQTYQLRHGERYRVRIIVAESMSEAGELLDRARAGESFSDLASLNSTDPSAAQGGLLSPINLLDPTYPSALRQALETLEVGDVSNLVGVDDRFIIIKLEEKLPADEISYEAALPELVRIVRREAEGQLMQQAARSMLTEAKVVVLDPALNKSWRDQQQRTRSE